MPSPNTSIILPLKSPDRVVPVLQEPVNPPFKLYGWSLVGHYRRYCREVYSKTGVRRIGSAKLVILDAPILQKPLRLSAIGLNKQCFKPLQCQQDLF